MAGSLTRYGNILEDMKKNDRWSYDFGLYKYSSPKKQEFSVKIVFGVVVVCCCVVGVSTILIIEYDIVVLFIVLQGILKRIK